VPQIAELAAPILGLPVSLGQTNSISGLKSALDQPEFVTAIGLAKFGSLKSRKREGKSSFASGIKGVFGKFMQRP
jgi:cell division ATPase FtsA